MRVQQEVDALLRRQKEVANAGNPPIPDKPQHAPAGAQPGWKSKKFVSTLFGAFGGEKAPAPAMLCEQALALERSGRMSEAVKLLRQASDAGSGAAAKKLGEIYANGAGDVPRDSKASQLWFVLAESRGEKGLPRKGK